MFDLWSPAHSVLREKVLEHVFLSELAKALLLDLHMPFEVLRSEFDAHGYDVVIEAAGIVRHVQLKATRRGGKRAAVDLNQALLEKPGGCVIWFTVDERTLALGPFFWLGGAAGEPLPTPEGRPVRHSRGNAAGFKAVRAGLTQVPRSRFRRMETVREIAEALFLAPLLTERWRAKTGFPVGVGPASEPPDIRYRLADGRVQTVQRLPGGEIVHGELEPGVCPFEMGADGWYDADGRFLGEGA